MEMRALYWSLQLFLFACLALWVNSASAQTPPNYLPQLTMIQASTVNTSPDKIQVQVVPVNNANRDYAICVGWRIGTTMTLTKHMYSALTNTVYNSTDLSTTTAIKDFYIMSPGTLQCQVLYLTTTNSLISCSNAGVTRCSADVPFENNPLYIGQVNQAVGVSDGIFFYTNGTDAFGDGYQGKLAPPALYSSLSATLWGTSNYITALEKTNGGYVPPGVYEKALGTWTQQTVAQVARAPSVAGWSGSSPQWVVCFDTGANDPADSYIYCKAKGQLENTIDDGAGAGAFFEQSMVSAVHDDYGIVSTVAWSLATPQMRMYVINRADGSLVPGTVWLDNRVANRVAHHSANGLVAIVQFSSSASDLRLYAHDFKPTFLPQGPVTTDPVAPVASPSLTPQSSNSPSLRPLAPLASTTPGSPQSPIPNQTPLTAPTSELAPDGSVIGTPGTPDSGSAGLTQGAKIGVGIAVSAVGAGAGLFVLLFLLKKKRDKKKQKSDETPMDPVDGSKEPGSDNTYGNLPGMDNGKYSNINLTSNSKYGNVSVAGSDDGIAVPTSIQPSEIDKRMHIPYKSLVFVKEIGAGSYGKVYLGEWRGAKVAIKVNNTVTDVDGFLAEAKLTLGITPHPNLVQTFGVSLDGPNPCIVLEYCGGGSLDQLFGGDKGLTNEKRLEYALKIGYGLLHLHSRSIVHRDLAARNILLTNDGQPKISDFGMSRIVQEEAAKGRTKTNFGPIRWMAPECLKDKSYSLKSDVWSFGIILYELVAGKEPHEDADQLEIALKIRDKGETPKIPEDCDPVLRECMEMCWKFSPNDRPTMEDVCDFLRSKSPDS